MEPSKYCTQQIIALDMTQIQEICFHSRHFVQQNDFLHNLPQILYLYHRIHIPMLHHQEFAFFTGVGISSSVEESSPTDETFDVFDMSHCTPISIPGQGMSH